ncbi:MAG: hypothetical protein ACR5LD_08490 [Symbiopectobacterium sp.]
MQHVVAALWKQIVERPLPSGTDSFFRTGGNSLLVTNMNIADFVSTLELE